MSRCDREGGGSLARDWRAGTGWDRLCNPSTFYFCMSSWACSSALAVEELSDVTALEAVG